MATTTPNFGWVVPTSTDLVKDGATAIETLGDSIDASLVDLKGGTTGQILAKNSNTDMDFVWAAATSGDITGVTAGTGISGGGTSGDVTITNSMATAITTAGDLIKGTGSGTFDRLGIGSTGQVLTVAAGAPSWATPSTPTSKVVQIITASVSVETSSASTSWTSTSLTASITPTSSSNKVLVMVNQNGCMKTGANTNGGLRLMRGATVLKQFDDKFGDNSTTTQTPLTGIGFMWLDSPATTSATTYSVQFHNATGSGSVYVGFGGSDAASSIVLMEVTP